MEDQPVIDMACGVLMVSFACGTQDARDLLAAVAGRADLHVWEVAQTVTATATGKPMPKLLQEHLVAQRERLRRLHQVIHQLQRPGDKAVGPVDAP